MILGVVGNCQSRAMAQCLERMLPTAEVRLFQVNTPAAETPRPVEDLADCDLVLSQFVGAEWGALSTETIKASGKRIALVPNLTFTGFHPDMCLLRRPGGIVLSPVGAPHSRIIAAAFRLGLAEARTKALFNAYVFARLGYFDEAGKSQAHLEGALQRSNLSLRLADLLADGVFMHTNNHATIGATAKLAFDVAKRSDLSPEWRIDGLEDELLDHSIWPVYPEIACRLFGWKGGYRFTKATRMALDGVRTIDLDQMIAQSFAIYADQDDIDFAPIDEAAGVISDALVSGYDTSSERITKASRA